MSRGLQNCTIDFKALPIGGAFAFFANNNFIVYSPYWHILKIIQKYFSKSIANSNKGVTFTSTNNDNDEKSIRPQNVPRL